jgi:hypothetical protein
MPARPLDLLGRAEQSSPNAALRRAEGAGLDCESADRAIINVSRCTSSSDTVREVEYQILQPRRLWGYPAIVVVGWRFLRGWRLGWPRRTRFRAQCHLFRDRFGFACQAEAIPSLALD